jgi:uncharacterized alkaline shock family protein YloU
MRIFMRFLLTIYILAVLFVTCIILACCWGIIIKEVPGVWLSLLYGNNINQIIVSAIGIVIIIVSFSLMFFGIRKRRPKSTLVKSTGLGTIYISLSALEEMVVRHISSNVAIRGVKASIMIRDSKANINARISISEGSNIPEVLQSLQTSLKEHIEVLAGIQVNKILMLVEKTSQVVKARVE